MTGNKGNKGKGNGMPPEGAAIVDNSILSAVAQCDTYDYVTYGCHLRPKGTALALEAGSAVHVGLAEWLRGGAKASAIPKAMAAVRQYYQKAVTAWELRAEKPVPEGDRFHPDWVYGIAEQYMRAQSGRFPYKLVGTVIEQPVAAHLTDIDGRPVWIVARLDARVRKFASGGKWNLDWKTTKKVTDWWTDKTKVRSQFLGQLWIGQQTEPQPLEGVILGVIEIPEKHKSEMTCKQHGVSFQKCSMLHAGSDFIYITPHRGELPVWEQGAVWLARRHLRLKAKAEAEGIEGVAGVKMQGRFNESCTFCEHREWCRAGRPTTEANVRATFEKRVWDPTRTSD